MGKDFIHLKALSQIYNEDIKKQNQKMSEELSKYLSEEVCDDCEGKRLNLSARSINKKNIDEELLT